MACPTCDHTMHSIGKLSASQDILYWCPRCGTIRRHTPARPLLQGQSDACDCDEVPMIVKRANLVIDEMHLCPDLEILAHRVGLTESCRLPKDRTPNGAKEVG